MSLGLLHVQVGGLDFQERLLLAGQRATCLAGSNIGHLQVGCNSPLIFGPIFTALLRGSQVSHVPQTLEMHPSLLKLTSLNKLKGALAFKFYKAGLSLSGDPRPG